MKIDGFEVPSGATVQGLVPSVTAFPANPSSGNSVNLTQQQGPYEPGIYTYLSDWEPVGDITAVVPGTGLTGGGASGAVTLSIDFTKVAAKSDLVGLLTKTAADALYAPIGSSVDLSDYLKKADAASTYVKSTDLTTTLNAYAKESELSALSTSSGWGLNKDAQGKFSVSTGATPYDVGTATSGMPLSGAVLLTFEAVRAFNFPQSFVGSVASSSSNATNTTTFTVSQNGTAIGTFSFAAGANTATFAETSAAIAISAGDVLTVTAPDTPDASLSDLRITLAGNLQVV